jgi:hypothetical protein
MRMHHHQPPRRAHRPSLPHIARAERGESSPITTLSRLAAGGIETSA